MAQPFKSPQLNAKAYNCPHCHAFAQQHWYELKLNTAVGFRDTLFRVSKCTHCGESLYWYNDKIVVPDVSSAPPANDDLDGDIKKDYAEAASIILKSPRGAAALLRLCLQKLCKQLGEAAGEIGADGAFFRVLYYVI
jgi:hypothetical protein